VATKLSREIIRETTIEANGRKLLVYLNPKQEIGFKFKGLKHEPFFFNLISVYNQLMDIELVDESNISNDVEEKEENVSTDVKSCVQAILKDIQDNEVLPYPYQRDLVKYYRKKNIL
jgi:hypothetical protein